MFVLQNLGLHVTQEIRIDYLGRKFILDFLLFPKWLFFCFFFCSILVQKVLKSDIALLRYVISLMNWWCYNRLMKSWFEKKALKICEYAQSTGIWAIQRSIFTWKYCFCTKSFNLRLTIEDSKICEISKMGATQI